MHKTCSNSAPNSMISLYQTQIWLDFGQTMKITPIFEVVHKIKIVLLVKIPKIMLSNFHIKQDRTKVKKPLYIMTIAILW